MENWIGQNFGEIVKLAIYIGGLLIGFGRLSQQVKDLQQARQENKEAIKDLRTDLDSHCEDDDVHINKKFYEALMTRLSSIEQKIDNRNENSGRLPRR
jgi:uncharacterized membrane protein YgaE (UPF0421/DUF939 family)